MRTDEYENAFLESFGRYNAQKREMPRLPGAQDQAKRARLDEHRPRVRGFSGSSTRHDNISQIHSGPSVHEHFPNSLSLNKAKLDKIFSLVEEYPGTSFAEADLFYYQVFGALERSFGEFHCIRDLLRAQIHAENYVHEYFADWEPFSVQRTRNRRKISRKEGMAEQLRNPQSEEIGMEQEEEEATDCVWLSETDNGGYHPNDYLMSDSGTYSSPGASADILISIPQAVAPKPGTKNIAGYVDKARTFLGGLFNRTTGNDRTD